MATKVNTPDPSDILDGLLFLGNARCAEIHGTAFDLVVNCTKNLPMPIREDIKDNDIRDIRIPIDDDPGHALMLLKILRYIRSRRPAAFFFGIVNFQETIDGIAATAPAAQ